MSRNDLLVRVAAALVGIVAIGFAAATVTSPTEPSGSGGIGTGEGSGLPGDAPAGGPARGSDVPVFLEFLLGILLVVVAIAIAWYLIAVRRDLVKAIAQVLVLAAFVALVSFLVLTVDLGTFGDPVSGLAPNGSSSSGGPSGDGEGEVQPFRLGPVMAVLAALAAVFVGALVLGQRRGSDDVLAESVDPATDPDADAAAVGAAAGRAAERIETSDDVDNEVYRAWRDMTRLLDVDRPATSTPREFATAAVEAGLSREDVDELTWLFEDVRYGHADTTAAREERAVAVLRRIEAAYAVDDATRGSGRP